MIVAGLFFIYCQIILLSKYSLFTQVHLHTKSRNQCQGDPIVTQYFNNLSKLLQELDLFTHHNWSGPTDVALYRQILTHERTYDFLAGLGRSLDEIQGRILGVKPLPSLDEIFAEVHREESRKQVMLGSTSPSFESSTLAAHPFNTRTKTKNTQWCDHCQRPYHTKAT